MSIVIAGALVIVTFILVSMLTFSTFISTTDSQGASLKQAAENQTNQVSSYINIDSTSAADVTGGTHVTVGIKNDGARSYSDFSIMDVLLKYSNVSSYVEAQVTPVMISGPSPVYPRTGTTPRCGTPTSRRL